MTKQHATNAQSYIAVEAEANHNVLKTLFHVFGAAGAATKNTSRKETILPLKVVALDRMKQLVKQLVEEDWVAVGFVKYRHTEGPTYFSLQLLREEPDDSGYNEVVISSETSVATLGTVDPTLTVLNRNYKGSEDHTAMLASIEAAADDPCEATVPHKISSPVNAAPKDASHYDWFTFTGAKPLSLTSQGGSKLVLNTGDKFGVRPSSTGKGKFLRLIGETTGINKVFTLAFDTVAVLIKNCKPSKAPKSLLASSGTAAKLEPAGNQQERRFWAAVVTEFRKTRDHLPVDRKVLLKQLLTRAEDFADFNHLFNDVKHAEKSAMAFLFGENATASVKKWVAEAAPLLLPNQSNLAR